MLVWATSGQCGSSPAKKERVRSQKISTQPALRTLTNNTNRAIRVSDDGAVLVVQRLPPAHTRRERARIGRTCLWIAIVAQPPQIVMLRLTMSTMIVVRTDVFANRKETVVQSVRRGMIADR